MKLGIELEEEGLVGLVLEVFYAFEEDGFCEGGEVWMMLECGK